MKEGFIMNLKNLQLKLNFLNKSREICGYNNFTEKVYRQLSSELPIDLHLDLQMWTNKYAIVDRFGAAVLL